MKTTNTMVLSAANTRVAEEKQAASWERKIQSYKHAAYRCSTPQVHYVRSTHAKTEAKE